MKLPALLSTVAALILSATAFGQTAVEQAQQQQRERVAASFVLALGRAASPEEIEAWTKRGPASVADLVARHREQLQSDAGLKRATLEKAFRDTYGRAPTNDELRTWSSQSGTYTELTTRLISALAEDTAEYDRLLQRVYQLVVRRDVYPEELAYWKKHGTLSFAMLAGAVENWARRNQPGLMVTVGTPTVSVNSTYLSTVRLSRAIAEEARAATGMEPLKGHYAEADYVGSTGRNIVMPGAEKLVSNGKIHFVAAGGPMLVTGE